MHPHRDLSFKPAMRLEQGHPRLTGGYMLFIHVVSLCQSVIVIIILYYDNTTFKGWFPQVVDQ